MSRQSGPSKIVWGNILRETEKAILIAPDIDRHGLSYEGAEPDRAAWIPLSQVNKIVKRAITSPTYKLDKDEIHMSAWIYMQKGFETFPEGHKFGGTVTAGEAIAKKKEAPTAGFDDFDDDIPF